MLPLNVVTILFRSSTTATCTGLIVAPGGVLVGCRTNMTFVAGPGAGGVAVTSNGAPVTPGRDAAAAATANPAPSWSLPKLAAVGAPCTAARCFVAERAP